MQCGEGKNHELKDAGAQPSSTDSWCESGQGAAPLGPVSPSLKSGLQPDPGGTEVLTDYSDTLMVAVGALRHTGSTQVPPGSGTRLPQTERLRLLAIRSGRGFGCFCLLVTSCGQTSSQQVTLVSAAPLGTLETYLRAEVTLDSLGDVFSQKPASKWSIILPYLLLGKCFLIRFKGLSFRTCILGAKRSSRWSFRCPSPLQRGSRTRGGPTCAPTQPSQTRPSRCHQMIFPMPDHVTTPCSRSKPRLAGLPSDHTSLCTPSEGSRLQATPPTPPARSLVRSHCHLLRGAFPRLLDPRGLA